MTHFNTALNGQHTFAIGRQIAFHHIPKVCDQLRLGQVTAPIDATDMVVFLVGTADPVGHHCHLAVHNQAHWLLQVQGPQVTGFATKMLFDLGNRCEPVTTCKGGQLADFDFVHVMVTTQQQQPDLDICDHALLVNLFRGQHQRFDGALKWQAQLPGHGSAGAVAGRGDDCHRLSGCATWFCWRQCLGFFHVGSIVTGGAIHDGIFTRGSNHLKFLAQVASNGTTVGRHSAIGQAESIKNPTIGIGHDLVAGFG